MLDPLAAYRRKRACLEQRQAELRERHQRERDQQRQREPVSTERAEAGLAV